MEEDKVVIGFRTHHKIEGEDIFGFVAGSDPKAVRIVGVQNPIMRQVILDTNTGEFSIGLPYHEVREKS